MAGRDKALTVERPPGGMDPIFRAAFETAAFGMAVMARDGRFLEVNEAWAHILGHTAAELRRKTFQSIIHPDDLGDHQAAMRRLIEGRERSFQSESRCIHRDGHTIRVQASVAVIPDRSSRPLHLVAQLVDISHLARTESGAKNSEAHLPGPGGNPSGLDCRLTLGPRGDVGDSYISPHLAHMLGTSSEALSRDGLHLVDFIHPDDRVRLTEQLRRSARRFEPATIELRIITQPGSDLLWWQLTLTPHPSADGGFEFDGNGLDVTQRHALEDRLMLREGALDSIAEGIVIADATKPDYPAIYVNPAFERITGYSAEETVGRNCRFLQGAATDPVVIARMAGCLQEGKTFQGEVVNHRKDGATFYNEISIVPVRDRQGRLTHFIGVLTDVTARHNLEGQLRQALKIEAVGKLAGGIAHDFNNLLMVAHGNLELLGEALAAGERRASTFLVEAQKAIARGAELTRRLLAFSRLQPLRTAPTDLNQLIGELIPLLRRTLGENIDIETALERDRCVCMVDRSQTENALLNLAVNARDAMPRGGHLTIATQRVTLKGDGPPDLPAGSYIRLSVTDTGDGMPAEVAERAFEAFFTTKEAGKGTGLGLSMVYGFARQSGGHATLTSEIGRGTTVSLYLPQAPAEVDGLTPGRASPRIPFGSESILLVEDEAAVRGTIRLMLEDFGYRVVEVGDGQTALECLQQGLNVDLVLTDVVMPGNVNGWQLAQRVWQANPQQKVLFSTGYADNPIMQEITADPRIRVLRKPFSRRDLAVMVRATLDQPAH